MKVTSGGMGACPFFSAAMEFSDSCRHIGRKGKLGTSMHLGLLTTPSTICAGTLYP